MTLRQINDEIEQIEHKFLSKLKTDKHPFFGFISFKETFIRETYIGIKYNSRGSSITTVLIPFKYFQNPDKWIEEDLRAEELNAKKEALNTLNEYKKALINIE